MFFRQIRSSSSSLLCFRSVRSSQLCCRSGLLGWRDYRFYECDGGFNWNSNFDPYYWWYYRALLSKDFASLSSKVMFSFIQVRGTWTWICTTLGSLTFVKGI
ncbi:hypothetical protein K1719_028068 [Acacia pycnantha]|nr:hypothetical protein K1719_028068 [Acacia pycnantha]